MLALLFLVTLWLYRPLVVVNFNPYDRGIAAYNAVRVGSGYVPYTDMYLLYGPGGYYLRALLFALFGASIATMQFEVVALCALTIAIAYWGMRAWANRATAIITALVAAPPAAIAFPLHALAYCGMLLATGSITRYAARPQRAWPILAGAGIGITAAGRWDFAVYLAAIMVLGMCCLPLIQARVGSTNGPVPSRTAIVGHVSWLIAAAVLTALPAYLPTLLTDPSAFARALRIAREAGLARALPYPVPPNVLDLARGTITLQDFIGETLADLPAYAFPVLGALNAVALIGVLRLPRQERPPVALVGYTLIMSLCGGVLFLYGRGRPDIAHTAPMTTFMLLSLPLLARYLFQTAQTLPTIPRNLRRAVLALVLGIALPSVALGGASLLVNSSQRTAGAPFAGPRLAGMVGEREQVREYDALVQFIQRHTTPGEFIFSGLTRHDRVQINDVLLYFAADRQAGVRDYHMDPGTTTTRAIQRRIIHDLQANHVRLVVLADLGLSSEPNGSRQSSGVTDLDEYIRANYAVTERFGRYLVLLPRAEAAAMCGVAAAGNDYGAIESARRLSGNYGPASEPALPDGAVRRDGLLRIAGWAATPPDAAPLDAVVVRINGHPVPAVQQCLPRDDVAARLGAPARYSGYEVAVDLLDIPDLGPGPLDIRVDVVDRAGLHHPLAQAAGYVAPIVQR